MNIEALKNELKACKTDKQVLKLIDKSGYKIIKDNSKDLGSFSIWLDDTTRIYKPYREKIYILQQWKKIKIEYSGIPTFFATNSYF